MNKSLRKFRNRLLRSFWVWSLFQMLLWLKKYPHFVKDYLTFRKQSKSVRDARFDFSIKYLYPSLFNKTKATDFDPHYTYHPAWAARIVAKIKPKKHIDISSVLFFSTMISAFVPTEFYDYRPANILLDGLKCAKADLTALPFADNSIESLSCMHTLEHVGLGRYGDPINPQGDVVAARELERVIKPGGSLIFVAPVGKPVIEFNSHRIYSYDQVIALFPSLKLKEFSLVPDDFKQNGLILNADKELVRNQDWGCGCFWFTK